MYKVADTDTAWRYSVTDVVGGNCSQCRQPFLDGVVITRESKADDNWARVHVCRECFGK